MIYQLHPDAERRTQVLFAIETMLALFSEQGREQCIASMLEDEKTAMIEEIVLRQKKTNRARLSIVGNSTLTVILMLIARAIASKFGMSL